MIFTKIKDLKRYLGLNNNMDTAINYILNNNLKSLEVGKHIIDGDNVFILIQEYEINKNAITKFEAHFDYADIQIVLEGEEIIGFAHVDDFAEKPVREENKDIVFYKPTDINYTDCVVKSGYATILYPEDAHMPKKCSTNPSKIKKAVFKIKC